MKKEQMIQFGVSSLAGTNKAGTLKQDEQGYVDGLCLGAVCSVNTRGEVYDVDDLVLSLFADGSRFMTQVKDGRANGENGHPEMLPGEDEESFIHRFMKINEPRVCAHHAKIYLASKPVAGNGGPNVLPIYGKTAPAGELGYVLQGAMDRPEENICFSVRGATINDPRNGITYRYLRDIVAFDKVNDSGIPDAVKWKSIALENDRGLADLSAFDPYILEKTVNEVANMHQRLSLSHMATESSLLSIGDLLKICGYQHNPDMNSARGWRGWVNDSVKASRFK